MALPLSKDVARKYPELASLYDHLMMCTHCGNCKVFYEYRPEVNLSAPNCLSGEYFYFDSYTASRGKNAVLKGVLSGRIPFDEKAAHVIFACTTCMACREMCETDVKDWLNRLFETARREAWKNNIGVPAGIKKWSEHIKVEHNPYLEKHADRFAWLPADIRSSLPKKAEYVYFVGCTASYRQKNIALATVELFRKLGIDFTIAVDGDGEWCCGSPALRTGQWDTAKELAEHNAQVLDKYGDKVITTCAGCFRTLIQDYQKEAPEGYKDVLGIDFNMPVIHTMQLLAELIDKGEVEFQELPEFAGKVFVYHDPCHLGRHVGVYDEPRKVLNSFKGIKVVEAERSRQWSWCCGAGGGVRSGFPDFSLWASKVRLEEFKELGAEIVTSACPFCWRNLDDASKMFSFNLPVYDLAEIAAKAVVKKK